MVVELLILSFVLSYAGTSLLLTCLKSLVKLLVVQVWAECLTTAMAVFMLTIGIRDWASEVLKTLYLTKAPD